MRSDYVPFQKRIVSLIAMFLVVLLLLPVSGSAHGTGKSGQQFQTIPFPNFPTMTVEQQEELADRISWMTAEVFNASLQESKTLWTEEQKQNFVNWLFDNHFLNGPCDFDHLPLPNTFLVHGNNVWPANIAPPAQGSVMQTSQGGNTNAFVIDGTTRLTYEELKSRMEAVEWLLAGEEGKKQLENEVRDDLGTYAKTIKEYYAGLGIGITDENYYTRADDKGWAGLAFGSNTTVLIVSQEEPVNKAENPYPMMYSSDMSAARKRALWFTLLNMGTEDQAKAIQNMIAALTEEEFNEFLDDLDDLLLFLGDDVYEDFYRRLEPLVPALDD